jgi:hypothetical protein
MGAVNQVKTLDRSANNSILNFTSQRQPASSTQNSGETPTNKPLNDSTMNGEMSDMSES